MRRTDETRRWSLVAGLVCALYVSTAWAQTTNASISGTITDNTGAVLPGVTITVTSPALQVPQLVRVSENDGTYQVSTLPIGIYRVSYELPGFTTLVREDIRLTNAFAARVDVVLPVATLAETITVSGESPLVDVTSTSGGATVTQELLSEIPTSLNNQSVFALVGGVALNPERALSNAVGGENLGAGVFTYGQRVRMGLWLEGVKADQSDVPDYNAAEEVDVKSFGNSAEIDMPGAAFNLIYRSGGNEFHGRLSAAYQNSHTQWDNVDEKLRAQGITSANAPKYIHKASGDLGGRIIRNKLWFFVARNWEESEYGRTGFIDNPGPDGVYLTADDVPGFPWDRGTNWTGKMSYQATERHKFIGYIERQVTDSSDRNAARFIPHEAARYSETANRHSKIEWQSTLTTSLLASAIIGETGYRISNRPHVDSTPAERTPMPLMTCRFYRDTGLYTGNGCGGFTGTPQGGSASATWLTRWPHRKQFSGALTYAPRGSLAGSHDLKVGFLYLPGRLKVEIPDILPNQYLLTYDRVPGGTYQPAEFWATDVPNLGLSDQNVSAMYVTDEWKPTKRLTVNAGVRWERMIAWVEPTVKQQGRFDFGGGSFPRVDVGTWSGFAPRLGSAFDLSGDGKTVVKATFGIFQHAQFNNFGNPITLTSPFNKNSPTQYKYRWTDPDRNNDYTPGEVNLAINDNPSFLSVAGPANNLVNPDLEWGRTHEMSVSLERELIRNVAVRALYVHKVVIQETGSQTFINVARPYAVYDQAFTRQDPGPDGAIGTADDGGKVTVYDYNPAYRGARFVANMLPNIPKDRNDRFDNLEISLTKRPGTGRWHLHSSLLVTKNHRWIEAMAETPNSNNFPLDETWDSQGTLAGGYELPYGFTASTVYKMFSGAKGQRTTIYRAADPSGGPAFPSSSTITLRSGPFGEEQSPARHLVDLRLSKRLAVGGGRTLRLNVDMFNALNTNVAYVATFVSGPTFGYATTIAQPRSVRFSARFEF